MNVSTIGVTQEQAFTALKEYKLHRNAYDKRDWEIERIYRAISKGRMVISVQDSIRRAGLDEQQRPRLAICQAHADVCICVFGSGYVEFGIGDRDNRWRKPVGKLRVDWPGVGYNSSVMARLPRIPPQHRPAGDSICRYHVLWEADWQNIPSDPYLLRRIGRDAWVVVAAWELTAVELSVIRAHDKGLQS